MRDSIKNKILLSLEMGELLITDLLLLSRRPYSSGVKLVNKRIKEVSSLLFPVISGKERSLKNVIYKLKKDGLIEYRESSQGREIAITQKGKYLLEKTESDILPRRRYSIEESTESDKSLKIIIFDIPEKERRKRDWLRSVIKNLGFNQLQQSVWAGNKPIPESLLKDIKELKLLNFVEIFSVDKKGTIKKALFE